MLLGNFDRKIRGLLDAMDEEQIESSEESSDAQYSNEGLHGLKSHEDSDMDGSSTIDTQYVELDNSDYEDIEESVTSSYDETIESDSKAMYMVILSNENQNKNSRPQCEICNVTFSSAFNASEHFKTHNSKTSIQCEICDNIICKTYYDFHLKLHNVAYKMRTTNQKVECSVCNKKITKPYLKFHMKMHEDGYKSNKSKQCHICDKTVSLQYFNQHMQRMHNKGKKVSTEERRICPVCERTFSQEIFKKHLASHNRRPKQHVCEHCGKVFIHPSAFKTHTLTHGEELKFKCQFCPYRGLHLGLLKVHVRTHTKDYLYKCTVCSKTFLTKSNLSNHERTHYPYDTFVCPDCNKGFYSQRNLDRHYKLKHLGIRDAKCETCGKLFAHKDTLLLHERNVHNKQIGYYKIGRIPSYLKKEIEAKNKIEKNYL